MLQCIIFVKLWNNTVSDMSAVRILGRTPRVPNKYELIGSDIHHMVLLDRTNVKEPRFWRNNVINAYCISVSSGNDFSGDEFWLGIYDEPYQQKLVRAYFTSYGGMCGYEFSKFYNRDEIDNLADLHIQEKALKVLNELLDKGIIEIRRPSGKRIAAK